MNKEKYPPSICGKSIVIIMNTTLPREALQSRLAQLTQYIKIDWLILSEEFFKRLEPHTSLLSQKNSLMVTNEGKILHSKSKKEFHISKRSKIYLLVDDPDNVEQNIIGYRVLQTQPPKCRFLVNQNLKITPLNFSRSVKISIFRFKLAITRDTTKLLHLFFFKLLKFFKNPISADNFWHYSDNEIGWPKDQSVKNVALWIDKDSYLKQIVMSTIAEHFPKAKIHYIGRKEIHKQAKYPVVVILGSSFRKIFKAVSIADKYFLSFDPSGKTKLISIQWLTELIVLRILSLPFEISAWLFASFLLGAWHLFYPLHLLIDYINSNGRFALPNKKPGIIYLARAHEWNGLKRRPQQLLSIAADSHPVIFLEKKLFLSQLLIKPFKILKDRKERKRWTALITGGYWGKRKLLYLPQLADIGLPYWASTLEPVKTAFQVRMIHLLTKRLGFRDDALIFLADPQFPLKLSKKLSRKLFIYNCLDDYSSYPCYSNQFDRESIRIQDSIHCKYADMVITVSDALAKEKINFNHSTYTVYNGVDNLHLSPQNIAKSNLASELRDLPHPIIGYTGSIMYSPHDKIDHQLLEFAVNSEPNWQWIVIGPTIGMEASPLAQKSNFHMLGFKDYKDLPSYFKAVDIWVLPHLVNKLTINMSPLKLYDYLATGKPIVSTRLPQSESISEYIYIADSPNNFVDQIKKALLEPTCSQKRTNRLVIAEKNNWENRYKTIKNIICKKIESHNCD